MGAILSESVVVQGLSRVPPFPPIAARLLVLLSSETVEIPRLSELISSDPTFSARLLQCANSVEFGLTSPIIAVPQALMLLGLDRTRQMVATLATGAYARGALGTVELRRCWEHTMATAILADEVARACEAFTGAAYTAGIIHDIGRLGLLVAYPHQYESLIRDATDQCLDLLDFERERFGMHHTEAGRLLIERWGLPGEFLAIAGRHHDPSEGEEVDLLRIVHVACRLADALGYCVSRPLVPIDPSAVLAELPARARARLRTPPAELREKIQQRLQAFDSVNGAMSPEPLLALPEPAPLEELTLDSASTEPRARTSWRQQWPAVLGAAGIGAFAAFLLWG